MAMCYRTGCAHGHDQHLDLPDAANAGKCTVDGCMCAAYMTEGDPGEPRQPDASLTIGQDVDAFVAACRRSGLTVEHFHPSTVTANPTHFAALATDPTPADPDADGDDDSTPQGDTDEDTPPDVPGMPFRAVLIQEGVETSDDRFIEPNALTWRTPPLPLMVQLKADHGGMGDTAASVGGRIDVITREPGEQPGTFDIVATGIFDSEGDVGMEAARLVAGKFLQGVSADLAVSAADVEITAVDEDGWPIGERFIVTAGELGMATVTPFPAFGDCQIELTDPAALTPAEADVGMELPEVGDRIPILASAAASFTWHWVEEEPVTVTAAGGPLAPPSSWFTDRPAQLKAGQPLTLTDDGRVYGYAWSWQDRYSGNPSIRPPRESDMTFPYFHLGVTRTSEGEDVRTGKITFGAGHASIYASSGAALDHYDTSCTAAADVVMHTDEHGAWFTGALRPGLTDEQVREIRSTGQVSGDWRAFRNGGPRELVACLVVPVPGFPQVRLAASAQPMALVAAGMVRRAADPVQVTLAAVQDELAALRREREADRWLKQIGV